LGEHGDSMVPIFSLAKLNKKPVLDLLSEEQIEKITNDVRYYWKALRRLKGPSVFGIAKRATDVVRSIITNKELAIPASIMLNGEYGHTDICIGVPVLLGPEGIKEIIEVPLASYQVKAFGESVTSIYADLKELLKLQVSKS